MQLRHKPNKKQGREPIQSLGLCAALLILSFFTQNALATLPPRVVVVILDGVRAKEAFYPTPFLDPFPLLRARIKRGDLLSFGDPKRGESMRVINPYALSLPGYQSILSGKSSGKKCSGNSVSQCPLQPNETLLDEMVLSGISPSDVVSLASWSGLDRAVSVNRAPAFFHNASTTPTHSPDASDDVRDRAYYLSLDKKIRANPPKWGGSRSDRFTREYYERFGLTLLPRFSLVQLVDTDEWGHKVNFPKYYRAIREDEAWLNKLFNESDRLEALGLSGPTHFIITTDHGRGEWKTLRDVFWQHGIHQPSSYKVWSFVRISPSMKAKYKKDKRSKFSHADIRPTIEYLLGLTPTCMSSCLVR